mmetsp:Transcript_18733/g.34696  ORF Transcript_18733/g.34696 Transcript_18733/m.34696 type:complete len:217 (+) Transcript_18733:134-784(+)|eukprot:CAMPEP_0184517994 /NCGR_PEP_ID=MMETSP0198_2-20121128/5851_1 /TAXON_ID=1112570 /ORGANISM="Thraustochytrium sp., Strain LLF1b" /LENGTH=216 /DNA_ID=CAMNT_0026908403 /DNA_START=55 /DNA_END=705 /DNA_ORIENTATION=-
MADDACAASESLSTAFRGFSAVFTMLIAIVGQRFSQEQAKQKLIESKGNELEAVCNLINLEKTQLLLMNNSVVTPEKLVYLNGRDWNSTWQWQSVYADKAPAAARLVMDELLDLFRTAAEAFKQVMETGYSSIIWTGAYDIKTQKLRRVLKSFKLFYNKSFDGIQELRQKYVQFQVGRESDWYQIVDMLEMFDVEVNRNAWPWLFDSPQATLPAKA